MSKMVKAMWTNNLRDFERKCEEMGYISIKIVDGTRIVKTINQDAYTKAIQSFHKNFGMCPA